MAVLSDVRILENIYDKEFVIEPFVYKNIQPSSIDLTLDARIKIPKTNFHDPINPFDKNMENHFEEKELNNFYLEPGAFIIAQIKEKIKMSSKLTGSIQNRNSLIRLGINVGLSSYINPGYEGKLPIVIHNIGKFKVDLTPGMRICQLILNDVVPNPERDYSQRHDAKYHGEEEISLPKLYLDYEFVEYIQKNKLQSDKINKDKLSQFLIHKIEEEGKNILNSIKNKYGKRIGLE